MRVARCNARRSIETLRGSTNPYLAQQVNVSTLGEVEHLSSGDDEGDPSASNRLHAEFIATATSRATLVVDGRQVAYASQFMDRIARSHRGAATIKSKLCSVGGFNPDEWELPPKPKWMRWRTYNRMVERFDRYEVMGEEGLLKALARVVYR